MNSGIAVLRRDALMAAGASLATSLLEEVMPNDLSSQQPQRTPCNPTRGEITISSAKLAIHGKASNSIEHR